MLIQLNSIPTTLLCQVKVDQLTCLINKYDVGMQVCLDVVVNWVQFTLSEMLASLFAAEVKLRSVTSYNLHENPQSKHQQGGMGLIAVNEIAEYCTKSLEQTFGILGDVAGSY